MNRAATVALCVLGIVVIIIALRSSGPSDLWHQTQSKTTNYTADMLAHGRWLVPRDQTGQLATKPPLYNWLAAPGVAAFGFAHEWAHKLPSMAAFALLCLLVARVTLRHFGAFAAVSATAMLAANYTIFKLACLARPDMLLTLLLVVMWHSATRVLLAEGRQNQAPIRFDIALFWFATAAAWLTKGPPALLGPAYMLLGARLLAGRWSAAYAFRWWWGLPLSLAPFIGWLLAVYNADPDYLFGTLLGDEVTGRVIGSGTETSDDGWLALVLGLGDMPFYFLTRSAPWSLLCIAAMVALFRNRRSAARTPPPAGTDPGESRFTLRAAALWILLVIGFFTLSAGKRADYIAAAYPTAVMLAAWLVTRSPNGQQRPLAAAFIAIAAAVSLSTIAIVERAEPAAPHKGYGDAIHDFTSQAAAVTASDDDPVIFRKTRSTYLLAFIGRGRVGDVGDVLALARAGRAFWLIEGEPRNAPRDRLPDLARWQRLGVQFEPVLTSPALPRSDSWPRRIIVYRVTP